MCPDAIETKSVRASLIWHKHLQQHLLITALPMHHVEDINARVFMNLSILDNDGTFGDLWCGNDGQFPCPDDPLPILHNGLNWNRPITTPPAGTGQLWCGHDGQFPCPDDPLPILSNGVNWNHPIAIVPAGTGRLTFKPVGAGASGNHNDTSPEPVPGPSNNGTRPTPTTTPFDFEAWFKANKTLALAGGGLLLVLLLKK